MSRIGRSELNYGMHRSIEHTLKKIDAVTVEEVNAVARRLLDKRYGAAFSARMARNGHCPNNFGRW